MPTAIITGGAQRIGQTLAFAFAEKGFSIALHYNRSREKAEKTAEHIRNNHGICELFQAELTNMDSVKHLIPTIKKQFSDCEILVNNASVFKRMEYLDTDENLFDEALNIHLKAPFFLTQSFAKQFEKGLIINMLDTKINKELTSYMAYILSKKGLANFTRLAAKTLGPNFRVNGIAPGIIMPSEETSQEMVDRIKMQLPLQKQGTVDQIAQAALFLLENKYITGDILYIDGGEHLN